MPCTPLGTEIGECVARRQRPAAGLRGEVRSRRWAFYRRAWPHVLVLWAVMALLTAGMQGLMPTNYGSGLLVGVIATATVLLTDRIAADSDGSWRFARGLEAEVWTAGDLAWFRRLRRLHGERWHVVHSIGFHRGDVDHVLIGPRGVFAVETKYRSVDVRFAEDRALAEAAEQVGGGARRIQALIRQHTGVDVVVEPVIVTQGRGWTWHDDEYQRRSSDVRVLRGLEARRWDLVGDQPLARATASEIAGSLNSYARKQLRRSREG